MSTATLTSAQRRNVALFASANGNLGLTSRYELPEYDWVKGPSGDDILVIKKAALFRSGEFADSMGYEHLWEDIHIQTMAANFALLQNSNTLPNVPLRCDHPSFINGSMDKVIGYHENVVAEKAISKVDGQEYTYLFADLWVIKKEAQTNILSGLWRSRSAEVGSYISNNKAEYWPALMGTAYVDIPAVEGVSVHGLHAEIAEHLSHYSKPENKFALLMEEKVEPGKDANGNVITPAPQPTPGAASQHAAPQPTFVFNLGSETTSDFAKVQAHITAQDAVIAANKTKIDSLEVFQKEQLEAGRTNFAKALVTSGKILASQEEATIEFCKNMTAEMFESYSKLMADAPQQPVLGNYGHQPVTGAPGSQQATADAQKAEKVAVLVDQVKMHKQSGLSKEQYSKFGSYLELEKLDPAAVLQFQ